MINKDNTIVNLTLNKEVAQKLKRLAKKDDRTASKYVNNLIKNIKEENNIKIIYTLTIYNENQETIWEYCKENIEEVKNYTIKINKIERGKD